MVPCTPVQVERIFGRRITQSMLGSWARSLIFMPSHFRTKDGRQYTYEEFETEKARGRIPYKKPTRLYDFDKLLTLRVLLKLIDAGVSSTRGHYVLREFERLFGPEEKIFQTKLITVRKSRPDVYVITDRTKATRLPDGQEILIDILLDEGIRKEILGEVKGKLEVLRINPKEERFIRNVSKSQK